MPTLAQRGGNFSSSLGANIGTSTVIDTNGNTIPLRVGQIFRPSDKRAYAGNIVPLSDFDAAALLLLQRYPLPTASGAANNFTRGGNEEQNQDQFDIRIDHRFNDNSTVFGRSSRAKDFSDPVAPLPDGSGAIANGAIGTTDTTTQSLVLNYTQIFRPDLLNELQFGYTARTVERVSTAGIGGNTDLLNGVPQAAAFRKTLPLVSVAGFQQLGSSANTNTDFSTNVTEIYDVICRPKSSCQFFPFLILIESRCAPSRPLNF